jgi:hypothetical protein
MNPVKYRGYTIQKSDREYDNGLMFFLTEQGIDHDYDYDDGSYHYCGNCEYVDSVEEAKAEIDEFYAMNTHYRVLNPATKTITKFDFWYQAKSFCESLRLDVMNIQLIINGEELNFDSI